MGKKTKYMDNQHGGQRGFSLIELAIVIIISGTLLAAAVTAYKNYIEKQRIYSTQAKIDTVAQAMDRFFSTYGHYPCPASFSANTGDANFGTATDCYNAAAVAVNTCGDESGDGVDDYCVTQVAKDHDANPITPDVNFRIRKGSIPFQALKEGIGWEVDEAVFVAPFPYGIRPGSQIKKYQRAVDIGAGDTIDSYKNRFTYVLTEAQGTEEYLPRLGAITIIDEHFDAANPLADNRYLSKTADYVLVSHGQDGAGAYGFYGNQQAGGCVAGLPANELENCDGDDVYVSSLRYDAQGADKYDDMLVYRTWMNYYLWDISDADPTNTHNLNTGNVGIGIKTPEEKLHVWKGNVLADEAAQIIDSGTGAIIKPAGAIMANEYCGYDATGAVVGGVDCFLPEKIGGTGMDCDNDADNFGGSPGAGPKIMQGIEAQQVKCAKIYDSDQNTGCPAGSFIRGFQYNFATKTLSVPPTLCRTP